MSARGTAGRLQNGVPPGAAASASRSRVEGGLLQCGLHSSPQLLYHLQGQKSPFRLPCACATAHSTLPRRCLDAVCARQGPEAPTPPPTDRKTSPWEHFQAPLALGSLMDREFVCFEKEGPRPSRPTWRTTGRQGVGPVGGSPNTTPTSTQVHTEDPCWRQWATSPLMSPGPCSLEILPKV